MGEHWDPLERLAEDDRADWEVRQHLWARRRLEQLETAGERRTRLHAPGERGRCWRCGSDGRVIRLPGANGEKNFLCETHDPLAVPHWGAACCIRKDEEAE